VDYRARLSLQIVDYLFRYEIICEVLRTLTWQELVYMLETRLSRDFKLLLHSIAETVAHLLYPGHHFHL
jgi:hypothetical protein